MHPDVETKVQALVNELKHLFEDRLVSVCVYGSAVLDDNAPLVRQKKGNINVLVILKGLEPDDLERASSVGKWWDKVGHALPMFLSEEEWFRSTDVFALEYADIRDNHHVAYGKDLYSQIQVDKEALRLVCELELHRKLVFLRQRMLVHRDKPRILLAFLEEHVNSIAALFRGVLRLTLPPEAVPQKPGDVFKAMQKQVTGYDPAPLQWVLAAKTGGDKIPHADVFPLFNRFIRQLGLVTSYVDECFGFIVQKEGVQQQ